jgi:hypothetical protein
MYSRYRFKYVKGLSQIAASRERIEFNVILKVNCYMKRPQKVPLDIYPPDLHANAVIRLPVLLGLDLEEDSKVSALVTDNGQ